MTQGDMKKIREIIWLRLPSKEANQLIREIEIALGTGQDASRPGYKGVLG